MSTLVIDHDKLVMQYITHLSVAGILKRNPRDIFSLGNLNTVKEMLQSNEELYTILGFNQVEFISRNKEGEIVITQNDNPVITMRCSDFKSIRPSSS